MTLDYGLFSEAVTGL